MTIVNGRDLPTIIGALANVRRCKEKQLMSVFAAEKSLRGAHLKKKKLPRVGVSKAKSRENNGKK